MKPFLAGCAAALAIAVIAALVLQMYVDTPVQRAFSTGSTRVQ